MASCLKSILDAKPTGVPWEESVGILEAVFAEHANDAQFGLEAVDDQSAAARKEMRQWLKRGLVVERDGELIATDALERALAFLSGLDNQSMTSTASRLSTVQRAIESLEARLNPSQESRAASLQIRIAELEKELAAVQRGEFEVLEGASAVEGIREVYQLATSLRLDFRRVEDSYRAADRGLRQRILSEGSHRGEIVDGLLDSHDELVQTPEGQVFENFHEQLVQPLDLHSMKERLRSILASESTARSLDRKQQIELRSLVSTLVEESQGVLHARARSERDVRAFLRSGLADEQIRVGDLLQKILSAALNVDWASAKVRRAPAPIPPVAMANQSLRLIERLLFRSPDDEGADLLDLEEQRGTAENLGEDFWQALNSLDREELFQKTLSFLKASGRPYSVADLVKELPPTHDLETLAYWLSMAREAGLEFDGKMESFDLADGESLFRFSVPEVSLGSDHLESISPDRLG